MYAYYKQPYDLYALHTALRDGTAVQLLLVRETQSEGVVNNHVQRGMSILMTW
jgi:hypothetical protein